MNACDELHPLLHALVDGELDAANTIRCEQHLVTCAICRANMDDIVLLRKTLAAAELSFAAPVQLRAQIESAIEQRKRLVVRRQSFALLDVMKQWWRPLGSVALAAMLLLFILRTDFMRPSSTVVNEVVAMHIRSLQEHHLIDVATSDRHVVKPWFAGRIDFSPPTFDLADQGYELLGGRLDYLQNHTVAALVYRLRAHIVNVLIWPDASGDAAAASHEQQGYNVVNWQAHGMTYWAVSDLNAVELRAFQQQFATRDTTQ